MHGFRGCNRQVAGRVCAIPVMNVQNVNINVTNVTQVVSVRNAPHGFRKRHPHMRAEDGLGRSRLSPPPKLFRYCASCGVLDGGVAYGMNSGALCDEAVQAFGYTAHQLGSSVRGAAGHTCAAVRSAGGALGGLFTAAGGLAKIISGIFG